MEQALNQDLARFDYKDLAIIATLSRHKIIGPRLLARLRTTRSGPALQRVLVDGQIAAGSMATLRLARACGIRTPEVRLELAGSTFPAAPIQRFDRRCRARILYIFVRTALLKTGTELGANTEIVDFIRSWGADPSADFRELYLRLIFTILVPNKDDHLKNHGFLYVGGQCWRLSPAWAGERAEPRPHAADRRTFQGDSQHGRVSDWIVGCGPKPFCGCKTGAVRCRKGAKRVVE